MSDRKTTQPAGEIHLRQAVEVRIADQMRTLEIAVTLPTGATPEDIAQALQVATVGMRDLGTQLDAHVAALHDAASGVPQPTLASSNGHIVQAAITAPDADPTPAQSPTEPATTLSMAGFLKAALELGYTAADITDALGENTLTGLDRADALARLRALSSAPTPIRRGFAEEDGLYDAPPEAPENNASTDSDSDLEMDEPDFGPVAEETRDGVFTASTPPETPEVIAARQRDEAMRHLRTLRNIRAAGAAATPEQRTALANVVVGPLGRERAQDLIIAIWHPAPGEKLNAPRTRALVEWAKEDDHFEETAEQVIALAQQPATQEG